jgi:hypothetical protein
MDFAAAKARAQSVSGNYRSRITAAPPIKLGGRRRSQRQAPIRQHDLDIRGSDLIGRRHTSAPLHSHADRELFSLSEESIEAFVGGLTTPLRGNMSLMDFFPTFSEGNLVIYQGFA